MKKLIRLAAVTVALSGFAGLTAPEPASANDPFKVAQACGWYVVLGCYDSYRQASRQANRIGAGVVDTNNYPNFRNGYFCAADGPYSRSRARQLRRSWRGTVRDAYAKSAC